MSSTSYTVEREERLDQAVANHYGLGNADTVGGYVEAVLESNPGLADKGLTLPAGTVIDMPDDAAPEVQALVRLWT